MPTPIFILNGPNLNMLGTREPHIYGKKTLAEIESDCREKARQVGVTIDFRQSNHEGVLVDWVQEAAAGASGIIINPGAYGHTSIALHDALKGAGKPVVEVHLSNLFAREPFRHHSMITPVAVGLICGLGARGYLLAIEAIGNLIAT
ncbi:MAG: type II 3-dehydroquinate dehydratase [Bauldia sp.]